MYNLQKLSAREIRALRTALDYIPIKGIDAMFIGMLQAKLINKITTGKVLQLNYSP